MAIVFIIEKSLFIQIEIRQSALLAAAVFLLKPLLPEVYISEMLKYPGRIVFSLFSVIDPKAYAGFKLKDSVHFKIINIFLIYKILIQFLINK